MRPWILFAGLNGAIAVGLGAYAAHGLAGDAYLQGLAEQASRYQLLHALALLAADRLAASGRRLAHVAGWLFLGGTLLFSGSLYVKALTGNPLPVPMITPSGGVAYMLGWIVLSLCAFCRGRDN